MGQEPSFSFAAIRLFHGAGLVAAGILAVQWMTGFAADQRALTAIAFALFAASHLRLVWSRTARRSGHPADRETAAVSAPVRASEPTTQEDLKPARAVSVTTEQPNHHEADHHNRPRLDGRPAAFPVSGPDRDVLARIKTAINEERVDFFLQPIVSLPQRRTRFYEAYSRLRDANGRILSPADYLEAAERANCINVIDNMILMRSIQALRRCRDQDPHLIVFCNVSPATLFDREFFREFSDYLQVNADLAPHLVFEFTYPAISMLHPRTEQALAFLAAKGFAFSIDHVQSLDIDWQALRAHNFRYAKVPARLLLASRHRVGGGAAERKRLADAGINLIAEKIEREGDMPEITTLGIDFGQGHLFGAARPAHFYLGRETVTARTPEAPLPTLAAAS